MSVLTYNLKLSWAHFEVGASQFVYKVHMQGKESWNREIFWNLILAISSKVSLNLFIPELLKDCKMHWLEGMCLLALLLRWILWWDYTECLPSPHVGTPHLLASTSCSVSICSTGIQQLWIQWGMKFQLLLQPSTVSFHSRNKMIISKYLSHLVAFPFPSASAHRDLSVSTAQYL